MQAASAGLHGLAVPSDDTGFGGSAPISAHRHTGAQAGRVSGGSGHGVAERGWGLCAPYVPLPPEADGGPGRPPAFQHQCLQEAGPQQVPRPPRNPAFPPVRWAEGGVRVTVRDLRGPGPPGTRPTRLPVTPALPPSPLPPSCPFLSSTEVSTLAWQSAERSQSCRCHSRSPSCPAGRGCGV